MSIMEEKNNKILLQLNDQMQLNWGADTWGEYSTEELANNKNISQKNRSIAFIEVDHVDSRTDFEEKFYTAVRKFEEIDKEITTSLREEHLMRVGNITKKFVELIPLSESDLNFQYFLTVEYYDQGHDWFPLETGDELYVHFYERQYTRVSCRVNRVNRRVNGSRIITVGSQADRLSLDLNCMADHALIQANVVSSEDTMHSKFQTQDTRLTMRLGNIQLKGSHSIFFNNPFINGRHTEVDSQYVMWVMKNSKAESADAYFLSFTKSSNKKFSTPPNDVLNQKYMPVIGRVYEISMTSAHLLWIEVDGDWSTCMFRNNINLKVWGQMIRDYIPIGFPAQFLFNPEKDNNEGRNKHRFLFMGMNPLLKGRVKTDAEANNLQNRPLCERVLVSPHRLQDNGKRILVTSPYYAGYASVNDIPDALFRYCTKGIFTTEMQVPASVRIHKKAVYFNINHALKKELERIMPLDGVTEKMKICSIHLGTAYLTTQGGYPIEYICRNEDEEKLIRHKMFQTHDFTFRIEEGSEIRVNMEDDIAEKIANVDIPLGGFILAKGTYVDHSGTWHTIVDEVICDILPETTCGKAVCENDQLMLVAKTNRSLIAAANPQIFVDRFTHGRRLEIVRALCSEIWLCRDGDNLALMHSTIQQTSLLYHLQNLYGADIPVDVEELGTPVNGAESAKCKFNGIACGANYSSLFEGKPLNLQLPLSQSTPRVLFNDVVLVLEDDAKESAEWVIPSGNVSADGTMKCKATCAPQEHSYKGNRFESTCPEIKGKVIRCNNDEVTFLVEGKEVLIAAENLGTPELGDRGINEIFTEESEWLLERINDTYCVSNRCPDDICICTLIAKYQKSTQRGRGRQRNKIIKWIVKNSLGGLAITEWDGGQVGDSLLLVHEGEHENGIPILIEPDLIGRTIQLTLESAGETGMKCVSVDGLAITEDYTIPHDFWNWFCTKRPYINVAPLLNSSFVVKIKEYTNKGYLLERRSTLEQCQLRSDITISGIYQMKVSEVNDDGYVLVQNNVTAVLPWNEVSICDLPHDLQIRRDFLKKGTLLEVELSTDDATGKLMAKWRSNLTETYSLWKEYVRDGELVNATVHHISDSCLFLDVEGEYMFVTSSDLGLWEGDTVNDYFYKGQYLKGCSLHYDKVNDVFSISLDEGYIVKEIPKLGSMHNAVVLRYVDGERVECIVKFGNCSAIVPESKWVWAPLKPMERPFEIGDEVKVTIELVSEENRKIYASIINVADKPEIESKFMHLSFSSMDDEGNILLTDSEMIPYILYASDYDTDPKILATKIKDDKGIWLPIFDITDYKGRLMYECSYSRILTSDDKIKASLNESPGGFIVRVTVIAVSTSKLTVRYGDSIGSITQAEITGQQLFPLMVAYHVGDKVECVIKEFKETTKRFRASVIALYPNGFRDLVKGVAIDDYMKVIVCTNTKVGVRVRIPKNNTILYGLVPHEEIRMDADAWCSKWKDDYVLVKCIGIDYESGHIYFSRKQVLAENVED